MGSIHVTINVAAPAGSLLGSEIFLQNIIRQYNSEKINTEWQRGNSLALVPAGPFLPSSGPIVPSLVGRGH
jgi:hypothetical protein